MPLTWRVLARRCVVRVVEAGRLGDARDRRFVTGQQMPSAGRLLGVPVREVRLLLLERRGGIVARVEADDDDVEFLSRAERERAQR
jgi:hypothetical protein